MSDIEKEFTVEEKLALTKFTVDPNYEHIKINPEICAKCTTHECVLACPANCYTETEEGKVIFSYEGCVECGTCRMVCPHGSVTWTYPKGGFGVTFRYS